MIKKKCLYLTWCGYAVKKRPKGSKCYYWVFPWIGEFDDDIKQVWWITPDKRQKVSFSIRAWVNPRNMPKSTPKGKWVKQGLKGSCWHTSNDRQ